MLKLIGTLFKLILIFVLLAAVLSIGTFLYAKYVEPFRLTDKTVEISDPLFHDDMKIAFISDTHFGFNYSTDDFEKAVNEINENEPDVVLFGGDLIDNLNNFSGSTAEISEKFSQIEAPQGKFAVFGNHDYGGGAAYKYETIMTNGGFRVLRNEIVDFSNANVRLIGIDDCLLGSGAVSTAYSSNAGMYNLVLCHEPDVMDYVPDSNTDIFISGHSHGGQVNLPYLTDRFLSNLGKKYIKGRYDLENNRHTIVYTNVGLGTTKAPYRLFAVPEITYFQFHPSS